MILQLPKIYFASRTRHLELWNHLAEQNQHRFITTSSWHRDFSPEREADGAAAAKFWTQDLRDIEEAAYLLCYAAPGEALRGALIETGFAIRSGSQILLVASDEVAGTWAALPQVRKFGNIASALDWMCEDFKLFQTDLSEWRAQQIARIQSLGLNPSDLVFDD